MKSNPYHPPNEFAEPTSGKGYTKSGLVIRIIAAGLAMVMILLLLLPNVRTARGASARMICMKNVRQIAIALLNYESQFGGLPPAFTVAPDGTRLHSWRALILPYLEEETLYESIDFSKPWDDPSNARAFAKCPKAFRCESPDLPDGYSNYFAVVGTDRCFHPTESRKLDEITDGLSQTLMIIEVSPKKAIHWMSPHDDRFPITDLFSAGDASPHFGTATVAKADGGVMPLGSHLRPDLLQAMATIAANDGDRKRED